jgi:recombinational DNA repair ATPase RecF
VIRLESAHIEEVRGIRKIDISFNQKTFAISGHNGSGKSGVIDALEFGLTGEISRLTGRGTKGLSVSEHGPHVDKTKFPDAAFVQLKVYFPELKKSATITRKIKAPKEPKIEPPDADIKAILEEVSDHPEIMLARRDIIRFILVEPTKRSEEIQALLKLEQIGQTRGALNTASNKLQAAEKAATATVKAARETLRVHLQTAGLTEPEILDAVNKRRNVLGLEPIAKLTAGVKLDEGLSAAGKGGSFNKESALRDLQALTKAVADLGNAAAAPIKEIVGNLQKLEADPKLLLALQQATFLETGLKFIDSEQCPLCDKPWEDEAHLRKHVQAKLAKSAAAKAIQDSLAKNGTAAADEVARIIGVITPIEKLAKEQGAPACEQLLTAWKANLTLLRKDVGTTDGILRVRQRLAGTDWLELPAALGSELKTLEASIQAKPDQTITVSAQTFLTTAQLRLNDFREAKRKEVAAQGAAACGKKAYETYCGVQEKQLNTLYQDVQKDFSAYYREINDDDESKFTAKLTPSEGRLDLDVNFYERGLFPPGAYHSEGHQDGMGVCLYLALMKRLFGKRFMLALLDDVVMSVDAGHRYQFCKLLKAHFPDTQFIITTHDKLWAAQMKSAGLVTADSSIAFHSWTVDTGPLVESGEEIWQEIDGLMSKGKVEIAAGALRHHLEYVSRHLADLLGATPQFRADGDYELGELLPAVINRMDSLYGKAAKSAQSWRNAAAKEAATKRRQELTTSKATQSVENWAVNKAVHYNEWANFGKKDFEPVVKAFRELCDQFRCAVCGSWLYVSPRRGSDSLRCGCNTININLKEK